MQSTEWVVETTIRTKHKRWAEFWLRLVLRLGGAEAQGAVIAADKYDAPAIEIVYHAPPTQPAPDIPYGGQRVAPTAYSAPYDPAWRAHLLTDPLIRSAAVLDLEGEVVASNGEAVQAQVEQLAAQGDPIALAVLAWEKSHEQTQSLG